MHLANRRGGLWLIGGLLLSGCVSQQQLAVTAPVQARPVTAPAPPTGPHSISRTVAAGTTARLDFSMGVNPDCTSRGLPVIRILQPPAHGEAQTVTREDYPRFPPNNPRSACNTKMLPETALEYTPAQGFTGADLMQYEIITPDTSNGPITAAITVK